MLEPTSCKPCVELHGTIVDISVLNYKTKVEDHTNCKCTYVPMRTLFPGTATNDGINGADYALFYFNTLPDCYVTKKQARGYGWRDYDGNLAEVLPSKLIGGDVYKNLEKKLPQTPGRVWYEADFDYSGGFRNRKRIIYSNDGLVFVSYDHCHTFYEITN